MKKFAGYISVTRSGWTKIGFRREGGDAPLLKSHGDFAETAHKARPEADSDAIAPTGDQAPADVDTRAVGIAQPGNGREPDAGGSADGGAPACRSGTGQ